MKIGAIIQARVSSTRLPEKILKELPYGNGITVLEQVIKRIKRSKRLSGIIVATTIEKYDDRVTNIAKKERVGCFRGSNEDVLSRYYLAAKENSLDVIVRVTSDCPCIDAEITDLIIEKHMKAKADYTSNSLKRTYPYGFDVEVFNFDILEQMHENARKNHEREHVTPHIYQNPDVFKIMRIKAPKEFYAPDIRLTLDTEEDYTLLCVVFDFLYPKNNFFNIRNVINLFREKPWLKLINKKVTQKKVLRTLKDELEEAAKVLDLQDLRKARDFVFKYLSK